MSRYRIYGIYVSSQEPVVDSVEAEDPEEAVRAAVEARWFDQNYAPLCGVHKETHDLFRVAY